MLALLSTKLSGPASGRRSVRQHAFDDVVAASCAGIQRRTWYCCCCWSAMPSRRRYPPARKGWSPPSSIEHSSTPDPDLKSMIGRRSLMTTGHAGRRRIQPVRIPTWRRSRHAARLRNLRRQRQAGRRQDLPAMRRHGPRHARHRRRLTAGAHGQEAGRGAIMWDDPAPLRHSLPANRPRSLPTCSSPSPAGPAGLRRRAGRRPARTGRAQALADARKNSSKTGPSPRSCRAERRQPVDDDRRRYFGLRRRPGGAGRLLAVPLVLVCGWPCCTTASPTTPRWPAPCAAWPPSRPA
jgi:hypothetical protein